MKQLSHQAFDHNNILPLTCCEGKLCKRVKRVTKYFLYDRPGNSPLLPVSVRCMETPRLIFLWKKYKII